MLSVGTSSLVTNTYFFLLGLSLGLILQVLVIAVQNATDYADLGAATSGATFFRSIGGSFGVAVFGSIFSARLATGLAAALAGAHLPPGFHASTVQANPALLDRLPAGLHDAIKHAYASAVDRVFLFEVPVALAAFVLSWFLREVPLRRTAGAADLGEGIGAGSTERSSVEEIERRCSGWPTPTCGGAATSGWPASAGLSCRAAAAGCWPGWPSTAGWRARRWPGRPG